MNETQRNIKRYKAALPGLREKIVASTMLLLVSLSMVVSASFAWYTISSAPEVSMLATTIAANGNLEIALADGLVKDGQKQPDEVAIGDSSATPGKSILIANTTWGNLVNLSNKNYGLGDISLRPALLSDFNLSRTPLYGATYSSDGRVEDISEYYRYTSYALLGNDYDFSGKAEDLKYGVRAISSVKLSAASGGAELNALYAEAEEAFKATKAIYNSIICTDENPGEESIIPGTDITYMDGLVEMLELFVNEKACEVLAEKGFLDKFVPADYGPTVSNMHKLLLKYQEVLEQEGEVLRILANMQIFSKTGSKDDFFLTVDDLRNASSTTLKNLGIDTTKALKSLAQHKTDCGEIDKAITNIYNLLDEAEAGTKIYWSSPDADGNEVPSIGGYVSALVNINKTKVGNGTNMYSITSLGMTAALALLNADPIQVEIQGGVLKNTEDRIGSLLLENDPNPINKLGTRVTVELKTGKSSILGQKVDGPRNAAVRTSANNLSSPYKLIADMNAAAALQPEPTDITKKDTYGFAIDFWVRTNGENTILTLEGDPEYRQMQATCTNINGDVTDVYLATKVVELEQEGTDGSGGTTTEGTGTTGDPELDDLFGEGTPTETITMSVYLLEEDVLVLDENGEPVLDENQQPQTVRVVNVYDVTTHVVIDTQTNLVNDGYNFELKKVRVVTGYQGENRVWMDWEQMIEDGFLEENNTTQGAGSSYIFYADPSDQDRILDMLSYFSIAFLDINDNHLATAKLDVEEAYAVNGKVTVPLVVTKGPEYVDKVTIYDADGNVIEEEEVDKRGILALTRDTPTWLTAIVYVDGEEIGNENVLEAGVVEGRLNLQFGSANPITGAPDLPLQQKYRTITASATNGSKTSSRTDDPITYSFDGSDKTVTVNLTVEGDQPTNITGFFTRLIGKNHGTKLESKEFTCTQPGDRMSVWSADFTLSNPGEYVFLSALVDGAEYEFESEVDANGDVIWMAPAVKISGREILRVDCTPDGGVYYESAETKEITVSASIAAAPNLAPKQVRALFSTGDGKEFTVILGNTGNGDTASGWAGTARITQGGTYTLEYLVVDGDKTEITDQQKKDNTFVVKLGVYAQIECEKIQADKSTDPEINSLEEVHPKEEGNTLAFTYERDVQNFVVSFKVKLYDNQNNEIRSQRGVEFVYLKGGSTEAGTDNMVMNLVWKDAEGGYYEANGYINNPGTYSFYEIEIPTNLENEIPTNNEITVVSEAPEFKVLSPEPPAWHSAGDGNITAQYQFVSTDTAAKMYAYFTNADAAVAYAKIRNENTGEVQWVKHNPGSLWSDEETGVVRFEFDVPQNSAGYTGASKNGYAGDCTGSQDGQWVMDAVCLQDVYDKKNVYYPVNVVDGAPVGGMFFSENGTYDPDQGAAAAVADDTAEDGEDMSLYYKAEGLSSIKTEVVRKIFTTLTAPTKDNNNTVTLGKTGNDVTSEFMDDHNVTGVQVKVCNWNGKRVKDNDGEFIIVDGLSITYNRKTSSSYGYYTIPDTAEIFEQNWTKWTLTDSGDGVNYTAATKTFTHAGEYTVNLEYRMPDDAGNKKDHRLTVKLYSKMPSVKITDITMDGSGAYSVDLFKEGSIYDSVKSSGGCGGIGATNNYTTHAQHLFASKNTQYLSSLSDDGYTATLYFKCSHQDVATYTDQNFVNRKPHAYAYSNGNGVPAATIKLDGMGEATNAKLVFTKTGGGDVIMITQYTADRSGDTYWGDYGTYGTDCFEWTPGQTDCKRFIGVMDNGGGENGSDSKRVADTITANTLKFTYGGVEYTFTLSYTITINNPY